MRIHPKGFDDPESRRKWGMAHWRKSREVGHRMARLALDAYLTATETLALAKESGFEVAAAEAHLALASDHLAAVVLTINGHAPLGTDPPHAGFAPNAAIVDEFVLLVLPGDEKDPRRSICVFEEDEDEEG